MHHAHAGSRAFVVVMLGGILAAACRPDSDPLGPRAPEVIDSPNHRVLAVLGTFSPPVPSDNEHGIAAMSTGIEVPAGMQVIVTVSGFIHANLNPDRASCGSGVPVTPPGGLFDVGPGGWAAVQGEDWVYLGGEVRAWLEPSGDGVNFAPIRDPSADTLSGRVTGPGTLWVDRPASFPGSCSIYPDRYWPDYFITGSQTLTVEEAPPDTQPPDTLRVRLFGVSGAVIAPSDLATSGGAGQRSDSLSLFVWVDSAGTAVLNRAITLSLEAIDSAGRSADSAYGHVHVGAGGTAKPVGSLSAMTVNTGTDGIVIVSYRAGRVSGPVVVHATSGGAQPAQDTVLVGVTGLQALVQRQSDTLIGQTTIHTVNHHGMPAMTTRLDALADSLYDTFRDTLYVNDMSLPFGGVFDIDANWTRDHDEHRAGRDVDIRTNGAGSLTPEERTFIWYLWERLGGTVHDETKNKDGTPNTRNPHYHLRYRGSQ